MAGKMPYDKSTKPTPKSGAACFKRYIPMQKLLLIIFTSLIFNISVASHADKFYGNYVTKPEIFPGFDKPYSDTVKRAIDGMTWHMEIDEKEIIIRMSDDTTSVLSYTAEGKYLLAKDSNFTEIDFLIPLYIKDNKTIYGFNTVFFRKQ